MIQPKIPKGSRFLGSPYHQSFQECQATVIEEEAWTLSAGCGMASFRQVGRWVPGPMDL